MQGPAELLPVSSSGHLVLVPRLLRWPVAELDAATRKTLEVALHAGSAGALMLLAWRHAKGRAEDTIDRHAADSAAHASAALEHAHDGPARGTGAIGARLRDGAVLSLTFAPPALAGLALERPIEQRLGGARTVALAQIGAGVALWLADRAGSEREHPDALDHLAVGVAQATALVPGVSRAGAALTAGRMRGLSRRAAVRLSFRAALPVTLGAVLLKGVRAARGELQPELRAPLAAGALAALATGIAAIGLVDRLERARSLAPLAAYRVGLGIVALLRR